MAIISTSELADRLSIEMGTSKESIDLLFKALRDSLKQNGESLDSVAIPGFGTFTTQKSDERLVNDPDNNMQPVLLPPSIEMQFKSSVVMRKKILG